MAVPSIKNSIHLEPNNPKGLVKLVRGFNEETLSSDEQAELWRAVHTVAHDFLRTFFPNIKEHDRENLAQDVVVMLLRKGLAVNEPERSATYITNCAKHLALSFLRRAKRRAELAPTDFIDSELHILDFRVDDPSTTAQRFETCFQVRAAVCKLPPLLKKTLQFKLDDPEASIREIANTLRVPEGTVKRRLFSGRERLRETLDDTWSPV
jgi:RNA polymerase sigma factor (sigma-70 family)